MNGQKDYILLKEIINEVDPIGLVDPDTPESVKEYDPELKEILKEDISLISKEQLGQRVYEVFVKFFNEELVGTRDKYDLIADHFFARREHAGSQGNI